jgi:hypothetical protein
MLRPADLKGFVGVSPYVTDSISQAAARGPLSSEEELRADGFVAFVREDLSGTGTNNAGLSTVDQFKAAAGAVKAALAVKASNASDGPWTYFRVPGIRRAYGFMQSGTSGSGYNIVFPDGAFVYLIGIGSSATTISHKTETMLINAAERLYKRVHNRPAA